MTTPKRVNKPAEFTISPGTWAVIMVVSVLLWMALISFAYCVALPMACGLVD